MLFEYLVGVRDQVEQAVKPLSGIGEEVEELPCLFRCPHHDRRRLLTGPQPLLDDVLFPDDGLGALRRCEFDVGSGVARDRPAADGG
ncbi:hypothetical protein [Streptomyces sp. NPDC058989]|uniref:hypothetical protein n=1 Tax=Streptomyces sp. NPDC058989 TaxID=3346686 RepID=UPI0036D16C7A